VFHGQIEVRKANTNKINVFNELGVYLVDSLYPGIAALLIKNYIQLIILILNSMVSDIRNHDPVSCSAK